MIVVVNKKTHAQTTHDIYIGRGSPLGNPFPISPLVSREQCIEMYRRQFYEMLEKKASVHFNYTKCMQQLTGIAALYKYGSVVNLVCYCSPLKCHGDVIKEFIEKTSIKNV